MIPEILLGCRLQVDERSPFPEHVLIIMSYLTGEATMEAVKTMKTKIVLAAMNVNVTATLNLHVMATLNLYIVATQRLNVVATQGLDVVVTLYLKAAETQIVIMEAGGIETVIMKMGFKIVSVEVGEIVTDIMTTEVKIVIEEAVRSMKLETAIRRETREMHDETRDFQDSWHGSEDESRVCSALGYIQRIDEVAFCFQMTLGMG